MGFLSSLFGGGSSKPATSTNVISQKLPPEIAPYVKQILTEGSAQFEAEKAAGYQPYTGETTAQLTAQQEAALTGLEGLAGTQKPFLDEAGQIVRQGAEQFTGDTAQQYMSPYQQAVTDIELREAQRRYEGTTLPKLEAQAIGMGGMSGLGSRAGVEMAEAQRSQNQLLADIQAKGQQKSFDAARQEFGLQKAREREMAQDITGLGRQEVAAGLAELGALKSAGEERQALSQSALDEAFLKYQQEQQFPKQNLAEFSQLVYGNPLVNMGTTTDRRTETPYQPSTGQQLLGMGLGAANIYGMGGGFGGGFSGQTLANRLYGKAAEGGSVSDVMEEGLPVLARQISGGLQVPSNLKQLEEDLKDPTKAAKLIDTVTLGETSKDKRDRLQKNIEKLDNIQIDSKVDKAIGRSTGLQSLRNISQDAKKERQDVLGQSQRKRRSDLTAAMSARGASTKEIQDALAKLPTVGPGISTKTGSAAGIGQDVVNILDTLRTDMFKQAQQQRAEQRADIKDIGRLKRTDMEKGIAGTGAITEAGAVGKKDIIDRSIQDKKVISEREATNIMTGLKEDEADALKLFAAEKSATKELTGMSKELIDQFLKQYKIKTDRLEAEAKKITAEGKTLTNIKPSVYAEVRNVFESMQNSKFQVSDDGKGNRQIRFINGQPLDGSTRNKVNGILGEANKKVEAGVKIGTVSKYMENEFKKLARTVDDDKKAIPKNILKKYPKAKMKNGKYYTPNPRKKGGWMEINP